MDFVTTPYARNDYRTGVILVADPTLHQVALSSMIVQMRYDLNHYSVTYTFYTEIRPWIPRTTGKHFVIIPRCLISLATTHWSPNETLVRKKINMSETGFELGTPRLLSQHYHVVVKASSVECIVKMWHYSDSCPVTRDKENMSTNLWIHTSESLLTVISAKAVCVSRSIIWGPKC